MPSLYSIFCVLLLVSCLAGFALHHVFLTRLRTRHPKTWEALGCPTLFLNNTISNCLAVQPFLWRRDYLKLGDESVSKLGNLLRGFTVAYMLLFVLTVAVFFNSTPQPEG